MRNLILCGIVLVWNKIEPYLKDLAIITSIFELSVHRKLVCSLLEDDRLPKDYAKFDT
jgi:hypothetical protein